MEDGLRGGHANTPRYDRGEGGACIDAVALRAPAAQSFENHFGAARICESRSATAAKGVRAILQGVFPEGSHESLDHGVDGGSFEGAAVHGEEGGRRPGVVRRGKGAIRIMVLFE